MSSSPTREYRKRALSRYGDVCVVCDSSEDLVHHRDGDKKNNDVENLIPICAACHQKVHAGHAEVAQLAAELGKRPRAAAQTTLQVSDELADELHDRKDRGESYEDVIWGLIEDDESG